MAYFPLFVNLEGKSVLVVGGGTIAARRVRTLLEFGCEIRVVAPKISDEMKELVHSRRVQWACEAYCGLEHACVPEKKPFFVLAAAFADVNQTVVEDCRRTGIPVNDASKKENCDFYFPGLVKDGDAVVGITAGGKDHKLASALTSNIRSMVNELKNKKPGTPGLTDVPDK